MRGDLLPFHGGVTGDPFSLNVLVYALGETVRQNNGKGFALNRRSLFHSQINLKLIFRNQFFVGAMITLQFEQ